jgi:hypothetical protein
VKRGGGGVKGSGGGHWKCQAQLTLLLDTYVSGLL